MSISVISVSEDEQIAHDGWNPDDGFRDRFLLNWATVKCKDGRKIDFEEGWNIIMIHGVQVLSEGLLQNDTDSDTLSQKIGRKAYAALYTISYKICCCNTDVTKKTNADVAYERYKQIIQEFSGNLRSQIFAVRGPYFPKAFMKSWDKFQIFSKWMWKFFMHLDRFVVPEKKLLPLEFVSAFIFYDQLFLPCKQLLIEAVLDEIDNERRGEIIDHDDVKKCVQVIESMGVASSMNQTMPPSLLSIDHVISTAVNLTIYKNDFEALLLQRTAAFYRSESVRLQASTTVCGYVAAVHALLHSEQSRVTAYLHATSESPLMRTVLQELISGQAQFLLEGFTDMLRIILLQEETRPVVDVDVDGAKESSAQVIVDMTAQLDDLHHLLRLVQVQSAGTTDTPSDLLQKCSEATRDVVDAAGTRLLADCRSQLSRERGGSRDKDISPGSAFVVSVLRLVTRLQKLSLWLCPVCSRGMRESLIGIMNADVGTGPAVMLATYLDMLVKGKLKMSEDDLEGEAGRCMVLFGLLHDKDVFAESFRQLLARRLLAGRSPSDEDRFVVSRMKSVCGINFAGRLEGMLADIGLARALAVDFDANERIRQENNHTSDAVKVEFSATVLNSGLWPVMARPGCPVPRALLPLTARFEAWHRDRRPSHRLCWELGVGEATVRARISGCRFDLVLTTPQAFVLSVFSGCERALSMQEIRDACGFTSTDMLHRVLHSLTFQKDKNILCKNPGSPRICESDSFSVNIKFKSKFRKIRIAMTHAEEASIVSQTVDSSVAATRQHVIQATIVRVMKARKTMSHTHLMADLMRQFVSFQPQKSVIKMEIEKLIEKEYLKRSSADQTVYVYVP